MGLNFKVIIPVALMSIASVALAFVSGHERDSHQPVGSSFLQDSIDEAIELEDDMVYFDRLAEEFISMLPSDKRIIAKLIDAQNHKVIYYETTECPSCYCFDLETQNTSVLFGSETGFYIGTKLLILGTITDCIRVGDWAVFIATNNAPEAGYEDAVHTFGVNLTDHTMKYISKGAGAYFPNDSQLVVSSVTWHYNSLFTNEDYYGTETTTYDL